MVASQSTGQPSRARRWWSLIDTSAAPGYSESSRWTSGMSSRPCMVITVGVSDSSANGSVHTSVWAWMMSKSSLRP